MITCYVRCGCSDLDPRIKSEDDGACGWVRCATTHLRSAFPALSRDRLAWNRRLAPDQVRGGQWFAKGQRTAFKWARSIGGGAGPTCAARAQKKQSEATNGGNKKAEPKPRFFKLKTEKTLRHAEAFFDGVDGRAGRRGEEGFGIAMLWIVENLVAGILLNDFAKIHHHHAVSDIFHHG